jgi:exopolysaccharide production protein ExoZ
VNTLNPLLAQAWTLTYELMFYFAFGIALVLPARLGATLLGSWAVAILVRMADHVPAGVVLSHVLSPFVLEFLGGCGIAYLSSRGVRRGWQLAIGLGFAYPVGACCLAGRILGTPWLVEMSPEREHVAIFGPSAMLFVYAGVAAEGIWPRRTPSWLL